MIHNLDPKEVSHFNAISSEWWDKAGAFKTLHDINPVRLEFILKSTSLSGKKLLDVGCGGGILSESLVWQGANVTGIDPAEQAIAVAKKHAQESCANMPLTYEQQTAEMLSEKHPNSFDVLTCMELLEHVPDPKKLMSDCAKLVKPNGDLFFSTLNRTSKSWFLGIVAAEYILKLLPKGTHDYARFIRPAELAAWARLAHLEVVKISGFSYHPITRQARLTSNTEVNYLIHCIKA